MVIQYSTRSYDAMYRVREGKSKLERFYRVFRELFAIFFVPRLNYMFEQSLELLLRIPKRFKVIPLKLFYYQTFFETWRD